MPPITWELLTHPQFFHFLFFFVLFSDFFIPVLGFGVVGTPLGVK